MWLADWILCHISNTYIWASSICFLNTLQNITCQAIYLNNIKKVYYKSMFDCQHTSLSCIFYPISIYWNVQKNGTQTISLFVSPQVWNGNTWQINKHKCQCKWTFAIITKENLSLRGGKQFNLTSVHAGPKVNISYCNA